jgi:hypothetical protein
VSYLDGPSTFQALFAGRRLFSFEVQGQYSKEDLGALWMKQSSAILVSILALAGCSTHPLTEAVCVSQCLDTWDNARVLIWTNEPTIEPLLADWVEKQGGKVIDSPVVIDAINKKYLEAQSAAEFEHLLRQLGRTVGAHRVLAATVERRSYPLYNLYSGYKEGHPRVTTLFDPTITVRNMNVADETVQWSVTARGGSTSFVYEPIVTELAETALERAACEANPETRWTDERRCIDRTTM